MVKRSGRRGSMSCAATDGYGWRSDGLRHSLRMVDRGSVSMAVSLTGLIMPIWYKILLRRILNSSSGTESSLNGNRYEDERCAAVVRVSGPGFFI